MADNFDVKDASGTTIGIRAKEKSSKKSQVVLLDIGGSGVEKLATNSLPITFPSDLKVGAKSLTLTLAAGVGSIPIADTATVIGVKPVVSTVIRVGLEAPEADGTGSGTTTIEADKKKGIRIDPAVWTWFTPVIDVDRVLYFKGGATDVIEYCEI